MANLFNVYLHDGEGQTILGIGDGTVGQKLCLELVNQEAIAIEPLTNSQYHFELAFRPGTIFQKNISKISLSDSPSSDWKMTQKDDSFYFTYTGSKIELKQNDKLKFTLENIGAEPAGGSRGTNVELKYDNLIYADNRISGNQLKYLNIVNQRGSKKLPLYVGFIGSTEVNNISNITTAQDISVNTDLDKQNDTFGSITYTKTIETPNLSKSQTSQVSIENLSIVGSNRVLNDGTENTLILTFRYLNRLQDNNNKEVGLSLIGSQTPKDAKDAKDAATKFRITFDVLKDDVVENDKSKYPDSGYRLLRASNANEVKIKVYDSTKYLDENQGSDQWDIKSDGQGNTRQWIITCKKNSQNLTDEILRLKISDLKTNLQAGYANLYVYYENIPGYWDGHIICPIEKGPLMLAKDSQGEESIGIGTNTPLAKLHIQQKKDSKTKVAYFQGNSGIQIDGTKGKYNALLISNNETEYPALFVQQEGKGEAAHFGGSVQIAIDEKSECKQPALGIYQKQTTQPVAVFVGGNVGIGTADPKQTLDVNGNIYVRNGVIQNGGDPLTSSTDLGLYSHNEHHWIRFVTNKAPIRFFTDSGTGKTFHMSVEKDGNVGIGTTDKDTATEKLDVRGNVNVKEKLSCKTLKVDAFEIEKGSDREVTLTNLSWANPYYPKTFKTLEVKGNINVQGSISCGGKIGIKKDKKYLTCATVNVSQGAFSGNANVLKEFTTSFENDEQFTLEMACSRDLKENIASISPQEATNTLQQLNPVKYDYKNEKAFRPNLGFIAEEMPDNLASYDRKSLSPFEVTPILTKVVQEQQKTIALLQQKVDELNKKLNSRYCH
jgi:hypothetical protein